jgi:hypothetical protein
MPSRTGEHSASSNPVKATGSGTAPFSWVEHLALVDNTFQNLPQLDAQRPSTRCVRG